ncbi:predicted protein [Thalassiosira pseudonana CCMP1335]|uniref:RSE1/DDB1/CPSF1 C-terminal domain-containing protein n=1 Tax=Thalassiosira pseudonana TaxID=35128 RepID=B8BZD4_THAPS|nr:predicted protein [Thalassiosira pseudonana CCMP1335]EED93331.1 predicted protein [Thalassiosira pseudonana CCMP1335]
MVGIPQTMKTKLELAAGEGNTAATVTAATASSSSPNSRPVHPAVLTTFGPGKGSGSSEFSVWAYLTRPRPRNMTTSSSTSSSSSSSKGDAPLPNLVTANSNSLRVYTVLPHAGTLALTAVYDNLAGTICSLDVIPNGTGGGGGTNCGICAASVAKDQNGGIVDDDGLNDDLFASTKEVGHPRLSAVYPSTPMVGSGCWSHSATSSASTDDAAVSMGDGEGLNSKDDTSSSGLSFGVGQGGVLLASSIIDLTPALTEKSMGGTSYLEQDIVVCVSTTSTMASGVDYAGKEKTADQNDPSVSVVLGGGVAIASFSLHKGPRPDEGNSDNATSSWWRVASEPYVLPLPTLASKVRSDFGGGGASNATAAAASTAVGGRAKNQPAATVVGNTGVVGHGFGDIVDIAFLSGYIEPTLLVLHSNPKRGGGRAWAGRLGRTEEVPLSNNGGSGESKDDYGEDIDLEGGDAAKKGPDLVSTGTKYGLSLTAISLAIHQRRSVVLWSLLDALPADAWKLVPHPSDGVIVWGVNTAVYVSMGGKISCALAANGFAKIGCPIGLIPPSGRIGSAVYLEPNPSPLPMLALQLDGARVGFVTEDVAIVCLGNGSLYSLELHRAKSMVSPSMFLSMSPLGHRVGGLGVASCLSVLAMACHSNSVGHFLVDNEGVKDEDHAKETISKESVSGPKIRSRGLIFAGSRMGDCSLLAFSLNVPIHLVITDVDSETGAGKRKLGGSRPEQLSSMPEPAQKQLKKEEISPSRTDSEDGEEDIVCAMSSPRRSVRTLSMFRTVSALDSLTGLGPLGQGCYGPVATLPSTDTSIKSTPASLDTQALFSDAFSSAARHFVMPCGFGESGGLAVLTTPGRDTIGGSILCEADMCRKADGDGVIALRGKLRLGEDVDGKFQPPIEEFEEVNIAASSTNEEDGMDVDAKAPSFDNVGDVLGKMTLLAVSEFGSSPSFSVFFVKAPQNDNDPYAIVIMSDDQDEAKDVSLQVNFVYHVASGGHNPKVLSSITPMISKVSDNGSVLSISFGCVWSFGGASVFNIDVSDSSSFGVTESMFAGDSSPVYANDDIAGVALVKDPSEGLSIWQAQGCSHGASVLGQSGEHPRRPGMHEVDAAEIRFFISGPSLTLGKEVANEEKDAWMLRSLCILVDTSLGDLQLYSGSRRLNRSLEFSRVPLSCVARSSEEAARHFIKLRRKGIVTSTTHSDFRPNRLHRFCDISGEDGLFAATARPLWFVSERGAPTVVSHKSRHVSPAGGRPVPVSGFCTTMPHIFQNANKGFVTLHERIGRIGSQRLTLFNGLWDVFSTHGLLPGGGICVQKVPFGVTVRAIEFIDDASISSPSRPVYALLISREIEADQSDLNDDGMDAEERKHIKEEKEAASIRKQVEADLGGFDVEQEWVEEIEREECFDVDTSIGLAPSIPTRQFEVWLVDAASQWTVLDKYQLCDFEHATALKVLFLTDVVEDSDEPPKKSLFVAVGTGRIERDGEDIASKGRILLFNLKKKKHQKDKRSMTLELHLKHEKDITIGPVTSLSSLRSEDIFRVAVGAGAEVTVEQWGSGKLVQVGFYHAHMQVQNISLFKTFFLLSDAYDALHFLVWRESDKSLTLLAKDYEPTQVFAAGMISRGGAMSFVCHDDRQNIQFLQYAPTDVAARGGNKLVCRADFHLGSQTTSLNSHWAQSSLLFNSCTVSSTLASLKQQDSLFGRLDDDQRFAVNFGTTDGSFVSIIPLSEPTYWRLTALQSVMSNALESNAALSHRAWRLYRRSTRRGGCRTNDRKKGVIDADLVMKFVDLPLPEQEDLTSSIGSTVGLVMDNLLELSCAGSVV